MARYLASLLERETTFSVVELTAAPQPRNRSLGHFVSRRRFQPYCGSADLPALKRPRMVFPEVQEAGGLGQGHSAAVNQRYKDWQAFLRAAWIMRCTAANHAPLNNSEMQNRERKNQGLIRRASAIHRGIVVRFQSPSQG
jgi:hypothetical protein